MLIQRAGFQPRLIWVAHTAMLFYWPWLAGLPIFGALIRANLLKEVIQRYMTGYVACNLSRKLWRVRKKAVSGQTFNNP